jgi:hypothetical protein
MTPQEVEGEQEYHYFYDLGFTLTAQEGVTTACACFARGYYARLRPGRSAGL